MEEIKKMFQELSKNDWSHIEQIPHLERIFDSAKVVLKEIKKNKHQVRVFTQKITQFLVITDALCHVHSTMLFSLKERLYFAVDPLARIGLEHAVNLIYILDDETGGRTNELSRNFIETTIEKTEKWVRYARKGGASEEVVVAEEKLRHMKEVRDTNQQLMKTAGKWPNTFERFEKCGFEAAYRTIYAMNSDSVHCLSEDMFNFGTISKYPAELQQDVRTSLNAKNASLSIYLFAKTLGFFCIGLRKLSQILKNVESEIDIDKLIAELEELIIVHETSVAAHFL